MKYSQGQIAHDGSMLSTEGWTAFDPRTGVLTYFDDNMQIIGSSAQEQAAPLLGAPVSPQASAGGGIPGGEQDGGGGISILPPDPEPPPPLPDVSIPQFSPSPQPPVAEPFAFDESNTYTSSGGAMGGYGGFTPFDGGGDGQRPNFADGTLHPLWGGEARVPGGRFNDGSYSPSPRLPFVPSQNDNYISGGKVYGGSAEKSGGGGGGSALYQAWRDKLTAKLYPGSGSGYSGGSSSSSYPETPEERMRGRWARGVDPSQAFSLTYRPSMLIPKVAPGLDPGSPLYQQQAAAPAAALGTIMDGRRRIQQPKAPSSHYSAQTGGYVTNKGRAGNIGATTVNAIGNYYDRAINRETAPQFDELRANLDTAGKNSLIGSQVGNQPLGYAAENMSALWNAALSTLPQRTATAYGQEVEGLIDQYGAKFLRRPVGRGPAMNKWIGKRTSF